MAPGPALVLTTEPLPVPGQATTGAGLRAWGLAEGLRAAGIETVAAMPAYGAGTSAPAGLPPHVRTFARGDLAPLIADVAPSVVVLQHWGLAAELPELTVPLALDLAGPHLLERLYWGSADPDRDLGEKLAALRRADFVTCSGEWQRHYFLPFLAMAGFDVRGAAVLPVIPFSVPPDAVAAARETGARDEAAFVYGGAFLAWQNPDRAIRCVLDEMDRAGHGRLLFFGGSHPVLDASAGRFDALDALLGSHPRVERHGFAPFDELLAAYRGAGVALDLMERNPERELAFTTRTMVYLACGLPVLYNDYSELSGVIRDGGCGWTLSPDDEPALRAAVRAILAGDAPVAAMRAAALATASRFTWDATIAPLAAFCAAPAFREGKTAAILATEAARREADDLRSERNALRSQLDTIHGKLLFRLQRRLPALGWLAAPVAWLAAWPVVWWLGRNLREGTGTNRT